MPGIENNLESFDKKSASLPQPTLTEISNDADFSTQNNNHKIGDSKLPMLTITSNSARGGRRADTFYQDLVECKALLNVQLVRQKTKEFFDESQLPSLNTPVDNTDIFPPIPSQQTTNNSGSLTCEESSKMQLVASTKDIIISSKTDPGVSSDISARNTENTSRGVTNMASTSPNSAQINSMYGSSDSDSDVDNEESSDVTNDNNNKGTTNKNSDVTAAVTTPTEYVNEVDIHPNRYTDSNNEIVVNKDNNIDISEGDNKVKSMDDAYSQELDFSKLPSSSFLQTLEQHSSDSEGDDDIGEGYSPEFNQPSSLGGGGDGLPPRTEGPNNGEPLDQAGLDEGAPDEMDNEPELDGVRDASTPQGRPDHSAGSDRSGPGNRESAQPQSDRTVTRDRGAEDTVSQNSCDTYTKDDKQRDADPSEAGDTYNYEDDFTDSEADLSIANRTQTTAEYLSNYSDGSQIHSQAAGADKKSYTSVASSKVLHGRPNRRQGSETQCIVRQAHKKELKVKATDARPSPVSTRDVSRQSSSTISQPISFRQKAGIKVIRGGTDHIHEASARNRKKPSVPTQIKAEAMWCDGLLQVTLRGPLSKLPPIDASLLSNNSSTPTVPVDLELTFIPEYKPGGYRYTKSTRFPPKAPVQPNFQYYKKRKPVGSAFPTVPETDRNVIDNRAVGIGFNTQLTPPKDRMPVTKLPHIPHKQLHNQRSSASHNVASAPSKPARHSYRRS